MFVVASIPLNSSLNWVLARLEVLLISKVVIFGFGRVNAEGAQLIEAGLTCVVLVPSSVLLDSNLNVSVCDWPSLRPPPCGVAKSKPCSPLSVQVTVTESFSPPDPGVYVKLVMVMFGKHSDLKFSLPREAHQALLLRFYG